MASTLRNHERLKVAAAAAAATWNANKQLALLVGGNQTNQWPRRRSMAKWQCDLCLPDSYIYMCVCLVEIEVYGFTGMDGWIDR